MIFVSHVDDAISGLDVEQPRTLWKSHTRFPQRFQRQDWRESAKDLHESMNAVAFARPCFCGTRTNKISQGVTMLFRPGAATFGAAVALALSVTIARSEIVAVHSTAVVNEASGDAIVGAASMYNPFRSGWREGGPNTASGERYDPSVWAAAIKTSLRQKFGGVQYDARPKYALVEAVGKKVIVKINDVGPLTPGRIIDLNERTMRYFDPSLQRGVIHGVSVRPLSGDYWIPGPVG
jgi:rare lipoprotein A